MSRIGKQIIEIPEKVTVTQNNGTLVIKGPLGENTRTFKNDITISINDKEITLKPLQETIFTRSLWGTYASHIKNMIEGVTKGYSKKMHIEGVGYKVEMKGTTLIFNLGFSHQVPIEIPKGIKVLIEKNNLTISGFDKELVGSFSAHLVDQKPPEPYKGKGIIYDGLVIRRKQGKRSIA